MIDDNKNPMDGITISESETDPNCLRFDLDDDAVKFFEELLETAYTSPTFQTEFQNFVEKALTEQLDRLSVMNEEPNDG